MNAKQLLCTLLLLSSPALLRAQVCRQPAERNPFSSGRNICGLAAEPAASCARTYFGMEHGGFRPSYASSSVRRAGAGAEGRAHSGNTFLDGSFSFEEMHGKDMRNSMFINPGYYPIDVLEFTSGDKTLQTYAFSGGIAHPLSGRLHVGGWTGFKARNYAKRKDIRHTNYGMDFSVVPSLLYLRGKTKYGLSLVFRETAESIEAEQVGAATSDTYYAFFDKGLRYGTLQAWNGTGIHLAESGVGRLPVREYSYGAALQFSHEGKTALYADAEYLHSEGLVGEKGYDWYRFPGNSVAAQLILTHPLSGRAYGRLDLRLSWSGQKLKEAAWDRVTSGGVTVPEVYGFNTVSRRRHTRLSSQWSASFNKDVPHSVKVGYDCEIIDAQASPYFPYNYSWQAWMHNAGFSLEAGFPRNDPFWRRITLNLGGRVQWADDSSADTVSPGSPVPLGEAFRLTEVWDHEHEYMTSGAFGLDGGIAYKFKSIRGMTLSIEASWTHACRVRFVEGKNRSMATIGLEYSF